MKKHNLILAVAAALLVVGPVGGQQRAGQKTSAEAARGKYLVQIAGCNDCHTPGYANSGGKVEEELWLTGDGLGWRGPWGTTYPPNLRLLAQNLTAEQFVTRARSERRPPMPWFNLRVMEDRDVKAIYAYLKHLGPAGQRAPQFVSPGRVPEGPVVQFPG